jgi:hypothetical protein
VAIFDRFKGKKREDEVELIQEQAGQPADSPEALADDSEDKDTKRRQIRGGCMVFLSKYSDKIPAENRHYSKSRALSPKNIGGNEGESCSL